MKREIKNTGSLLWAAFILVCSSLTGLGFYDQLRGFITGNAITPVLHFTYSPWLLITYGVVCAASMIRGSAVVKNVLNNYQRGYVYMVFNSYDNEWVNIMFQSRLAADQWIKVNVHDEVRNNDLEDRIDKLANWMEIKAFPVYTESNYPIQTYVPDALKNESKNIIMTCSLVLLITLTGCAGSKYGCPGNSFDHKTGTMRIR